MRGGSIMDLKSEFSVAFVRAIAHAAGLFTEESNRMRDATGIDVRVFRRGSRNTVLNPEIALQVKCTSDEMPVDVVKIRLLRQHYDLLRDTTVQIPRRLVVVQVPAEPSHWLSQYEDKLELYRSAWWHDLAGRNSIDGETTTVEFPKTQVFDRNALINEFQRLDPAAGEENV